LIEVPADHHIVSGRVFGLGQFAQGLHFLNPHRAVVVGGKMDVDQDEFVVAAEDRKPADGHATFEVCQPQWPGEGSGQLVALGDGHAKVCRGHDARIDTSHHLSDLEREGHEQATIIGSHGCGHIQKFGIHGILKRVVRTVRIHVDFLKEIEIRRRIGKNLTDSVDVGVDFLFGIHPAFDSPVHDEIFGGPKRGISRIESHDFQGGVEGNMIGLDIIQIVFHRQGFHIFRVEFGELQGEDEPHGKNQNDNHQQQENFQNPFDH
jgi:hypothetical protein